MTSVPKSPSTIAFDNEPRISAGGFAPFQLIFNFPFFVATLFFIVCGMFTLHHRMWRDEAIAFLIARDSHSLAGLFYNLRYEGHPPLWHLLLYALTRITVRPEAAQALHVLMATVSVYLVARFSPFSRISKVLFAFGYFTVFEYGVIARNYQLFLLLSVAYCVVYSRQRHAYLAMGSILSLLCFSHVFGVILAAASGVILLYEIVAVSTARDYFHRHSIAFWASILLVGTSASLAVSLVIPPPDTGFAVSWHFDLNLPHLLYTASAIWDALIPIPAVQEHFWNVALTPIPLGAFGGIVLSIVTAFLIRRSPSALLYFAVAELGCLTFLHIKIFSGWRHAGPLFVIFIVVLWISLSEPSLAIPSLRNSRRYLSVFLLIVLLAQTAGFGIAAYYLYQYPFSPGKDAAIFLKSQHLNEGLLVARDDMNIASVAAYIPGKTFFFQRGSRWGTFTIWRNDFSTHPSIWWASYFARVRHRPVIMIFSQPLESLPERTTYLAGFNGGILADESYYFYRMLPPPLQAR